MFEPHTCTLGFLLLARSSPDWETALSEMGIDTHCSS
jgi:hypothetical protein